MKPVVFERGDRIYLVAPVSPIQPSQAEIAEYAFADQFKALRDAAPNPLISWFAGHYVEADNPNANGAMWTSKEIAIKSLTPMLMPVTVMHDPRTAVGTIANVALMTPEQNGVEFSKIETALALWKHRFPEAVAEAEHNYEAGTLMQSMECLAPNYACSVCGQGYQKLPKGAERAQWCDHLKASDPSAGYTADRKDLPTAVRILQHVCFTGTGLIYGSRGSRGADSKAYLESMDFQQEVAEFYERAQHETKTSKRRTTSKMEMIEIAKAEYERLVKERDELAGRPTQEALDAEKARADKADSDLAETETKLQTAETEKAELQTKVDTAEATASKAELAKERLDKVGDGLKAKLGEKTKARFEARAASDSDESWAAYLEELAEITGVAVDAEGEKTETTAAEGGDLFSKEEVASTQTFTTPPQTQGKPSDAARGSVIGGLFKAATKR